MKFRFTPKGELVLKMLQNAYGRRQEQSLTQETIDFEPSVDSLLKDNSEILAHSGGPP